MENEKLIKAKFQEKLKGATFKSNKWIGFLILGVIILFTALIIFFPIRAVKTQTFTGFIVGGVLIVVLFFVLTGLMLFAGWARQKNQNILKDAAGLDLHRIYFDNFASPFTNLDFRFIGIEKSKIFPNNCLKFELGKESIVWNIDQDIETRTEGSGEDRESYEVYILKFVLTSSAEKLQGIKEIKISGARKFKLVKKSFIFQSESIEFNQKYQVESLDQMEVYKVFTPKIIENFVSSDLDLSQGEMIFLEDNLAQIKFRSSYESRHSLVPDPLDFSAIRFGKNRGKTIDDLYKKVKLDFDRYLDNQELLEPLELYFK